MKISTQKIFAAFVLLGIIAVPFPLAAASQPAFSYGAWLPFWKKRAGAEAVAINLEKFKEISPFSYEIRPDGTLIDTLKITEGFWPVWLGAARDLRVKIIPTVALLDGSRIHALLSNAKLRRSHEDAIASLVAAQRFDGIDIDYEGKNAETKKYFSLFLEGLALRLHPKRKLLSCTIESRMPPDSQFDKIPKDLSRANDYAVINRYCDEVRIMTYDQGAIDLRLNARKGRDGFYMPVADSDWVEKVIRETVKTIGRKKIMLGIPTYGYVYEVSWDKGVTSYRYVRSVTFEQAMDLANAVGATPLRNSAGELSFAYATSTAVTVSSSLVYTISSTTIPAFVASSASSSTPVVRFVSFSDAKAAADKIKLAKKYKLKGAVFFKMDGEADPGLWNEMK